MKTCYILGFLFISIQLSGQSVEDWTWYNPAVFDNYVGALEQDANGDFWMGSGTKIVKYDGVNWIAFDILDTGLPLANAYPRSIDASLQDKLWISTRDRVLEYDLVNNEWTIHDPTNGAVNFNASNIKVESENRIWWTSSNRLYEYDGTEWTMHNFYNFGIGMNPNSLREIEIDNNNEKWMTTASSICFDVACFTPAGVLRYTDTDTSYFDGETYGYPEAFYTYLELDMNNDPLLAVTDYLTDYNFYMNYTNDQWSDPIEIPFTGFMYDMELGNEDQIYCLFSEFIAVGENGVWDVIPLDTSEITYSADLFITAENDIYIAGRKGNSGATYQAAFGFLPNLLYRTRGLLYSDYNYNGMFDANDQTIANSFVQTVNQDRISFSNNEGAYSLLFSEPDTYEIEGILPVYHSYGVPLDGIYDVPLSIPNPTSDSNHIGFEPDTSAIDLSLSLTAMNGANPGFQTCYMLSVKNNAPRLTSGTLTASFDELLSFDSSDTPPSSMVGNEFTFDINELDWQEIQNVKVCFTLPPDPELIGDTLKNLGLVIPNGGLDLTLENNSDTLCTIITGPYDPNFIEVHPAGIGVMGDIPVTTSNLEYTIHFQNIGTDTARNVVISNPLDVDLDILSLNVMAYSHPYDLDFIENGRLLQWTFNDINLPDSTANEVESNGFIKYKINLANQAVGTTFTNQADIFFDFNLPITTNTTINTLIEETVDVFEILDAANCDYTVQVLEEELTLRFPKLDAYHIKIYDLNGRILKASFVNHLEKSIGLSGLPKGAYVVVVSSENCSGGAKIFIK